ncbi:MAG: ribonuclease D, partial [Eggerthellaceae bacterium]|nr:ribonuclease D [Eggerthellaceae bacterium]
ASQTLASQSELVKLARGHGDQVDIMHGWRREIVGNELQALLDGSIALSMDGSNLCIHTL